MIVGTAGHIDHGKTTLVRALTGVDTDRLPDEKRRGISIELGYAYLDVPGTGGRIGFVDVPGHERLVHTMIAGATGIDFALLVVAADDGPMPQTREHLAVLALLGIERGAAVVTKADRVSPDRVAEVEAEVRALIAPTPFAGVPVCAVSAPTGAGIDGLKALLFDAAARTVRRGDAARGFRLSVDRSFTLGGIGTVATGTAQAGTVGAGDLLAVVPGSTSHTVRVRVRSLHAQNAPVDAAGAGSRVAAALVGIAKDELARGQWLCDPRIALATDRLDAAVVPWPGEIDALRSGRAVHLHVGADAVPASVAVLDQGSSGDLRVQLVARRPLAAWHGDRIVLRDASATRTIAGGTVLDPFAPARYRRTQARLAVLDAWQAPDAASRRRALLAASPHGIDLAAWRRAEGLVGDDDADSWAIDPAHADALRGAVVDALARFHARHPEDPGPEGSRLRRLAAPRVAAPLWHALVARWVADGALAQRRGRLHLPDHALRLTASDERVAKKVLPLLEAGGLDPPWVRDLAAATREGEALLRTVLARLAQCGEVQAVVKDLYYPAPTIDRAAAVVRRLAAADGTLTVAAFRDATGLGRKRAIQIVEYFDRAGLLRRVGDVHRLRSDCRLFE